jgi:hypothetical protein
MSQRISYTKIENELWPEYRDRLNKAESTEDVKKFFAYTATELLRQVLAPQGIHPRFEEVQLEPENETLYSLSSDLMEREDVASVFEQSDLRDILQRLAWAASKRFRHLQRSTDKSRFGVQYDKTRHGSSYR